MTATLGAFRRAAWSPVHIWFWVDKGTGTVSSRWPGTSHSRGAPPDGDSCAVPTVEQAYFNASERSHRSTDEPFGPVVSQLAGDPGNPDWPLVFGYLRQTSLPVATFALLRALVQNPVACAMAAAHASAADFELLWERMELFPFAWWQIPLCSWEVAFVAYGAHWDENAGGGARHAARVEAARRGN